MKEAIRFKVKVALEMVEDLLGMLYVYGMVGCEEFPTVGDSQEYFCYFETQEAAKSAASTVEAMAQEISFTETIENRDWNEEWKKTIEPVQISEHIWVSPTWLNPPLKEGDHWIKIEPRMAFGTGHHETTRIASQALLTTKSPRKSLLDIGTGSGILCFVAQVSGFEKALGYEIDPDCEENLKENLEDNGGDCDIRFCIGTVDELDESETFDTIVMNIIRLYSEPMLPNVKKHLTSDGEFIWSGILVEESERVIAAAEAAGFSLTEQGSEGEWWYGRFAHAA